MSGTWMRMARAGRVCLRCGGAGALAVLLATCDGTQRYEEPQGLLERQRAEQKGKLFGDVLLFGRKTVEEDVVDRQVAGGGGLSVNAYLWQAALETLASLPLRQIDPLSGAIATDWHTPAETPDERFRLNALITTARLRSDGLRVTLFHQRRTGDSWLSVTPGAEMVTRIEDTILARARTLNVLAGVP